jgi:LysM repeat protein
MAPVDGLSSTQPVGKRGREKANLLPGDSPVAVAPVLDQLQVKKAQPGDPLALVASYNALAAPMQAAIKTIATERAALGKIEASGKPQEILAAKEAVEVSLLRGNNLLIKAAAIHKQLTGVCADANVLLYDSPTAQVVQRLTIATNNGANLQTSSPPAAAAPSAAYTIQPGDTLTSIARKNHTSVSELVKLNALSDADKIKAGKTLLLPKHVQTYALKVGDSLNSIAKDQLGDAARWREIYLLNNDILDALTADTSLAIGTKFKLPAR